MAASHSRARAKECSQVHQSLLPVPIRGRHGVLEVPINRKGEKELPHGWHPGGELLAAPAQSSHLPRTMTPRRPIPPPASG